MRNLMRRIRAGITNLGLWPRMALAISAGFIGLFLAFAFLGEQAFRDSIENLREERLVIAQIVVGQIDARLEHASLALEQAASLIGPDLRNFPLSEVVHELEVEGESTIFSSGIILLDADGRSLSSYPPELAPAGSDLADQPYVAQASPPSGVTISEVFQHPLSGRPTAAIAIPLYEGNRPAGLLVGLVNLAGDYLITPLQQAASLSKSEHAVLLDTQGRVILSTFSLPFFSLGEHPTFYSQAMADFKPMVATIPFELDLPGEPEGHLHVMAFAPLTSVHWGLVIGGDEADLFGGVRQLRIGLIMLAVSALAAIWVLTLIGTRRLVRPVQRLTQAADQIAAGNLDVKLSAHEGGEIGIMADALERMRNQLTVQIAALTEWNDLLEKRVAEQTEELQRQQAQTQQLLGKVITAQEAERKRVARELHDEVGQVLTGFELSLGHLAHALAEDNEEAHRRLEQSRILTERSTDELRRIIAALRPGTLDQLGLVAALDWVGDQTLRASGVTVTIEAQNLEHRLPAQIETTLFRIAQEAMNNVVRHSQATRLVISLRADHESVTMSIKDDGKGFTVEPPNSTDWNGINLGIAGMKERAALVGGELHIESEDGQGSTLQVTLPLAQFVE